MKDVLTRRREDAQESNFGLRSIASPELEDIVKEAVDCGYKIHTGLGPGLLESVYEAVLGAALEKRGLKVERQKPVSFSFEGMHFNDGFRVDLLVNDTLLIELKSTEKQNAAHGKQLLTYLRLMNLPLGLLMNFGMGTFKEGVQRVVNNHV